jgi:hypothetical protein
MELIDLSMKKKSNINYMMVIKISRFFLESEYLRPLKFINKISYLI